MPKPWEQYQSKESAGPWTKYQAGGDNGISDSVVGSGSPDVGRPVSGLEVPQWGRDYPNLYGSAGAARESLGPILEAAGMVGGGMVGSAGGPVGGVAGAGLGYGAARELLKNIDIALGTKKAEPLPEQLKTAGKTVVEGAAMEMGGQTAIPVIAKGVELAAKPVRAVAEQLLGATTGAGPGAVKTAYEAGKKKGFRTLNKLNSDIKQGKFVNRSEFTDAMRSKTTGDEIVDNVSGAIQGLKDARLAEYETALTSIKGDTPIDMTPIHKQLQSLMKRYNVKTLDDGTIDTSRIAMGKKGRDDIVEMIESVRSWGRQQGDDTAIGLDTLNRQLNDFWSESSQARQFVTALKNSVSKTISKDVPKYKEMTKGYREATELIKDIESGLMARKQGMTGRITADQTLRRLNSAMRENQELRKGLIDILGKKSEAELTEQVAGYSLRSPLPMGYLAKVGAGGGVGYAVMSNPALAPLLAAASPRLVAELSHIIGKTTSEAAKVAPAIAYGSGTQAGQNALNQGVK